MIHTFPPTLEELVANKEDYAVPLYSATNSGVCENMNIGFEGVSVLAYIHHNKAYYETVVLLDWCQQFGERYQTIIELMDALLLRWTERHHISGKDAVLPLYWIEPSVSVGLYESPNGAIITHEYTDVVCIPKEVAYDLAYRLGHITFG